MFSARGQGPDDASRVANVKTREMGIEEACGELGVGFRSSKSLFKRSLQRQELRTTWSKKRNTVTLVACDRRPCRGLRQCLVRHLEEVFSWLDNQV